MHNLIKTTVTIGSIAIFTAVLGGCATVEERLDKNLTLPSDKKEEVAIPAPTPAVTTTQVEKSLPESEPVNGEFYNSSKQESAAELHTQAVGYFYANDQAKALVIMDKAIQQYPNDPTNYQLRGTFYAEMQNFPLAIIDIKRAVELDPNSIDAWTNLGGCLLFNGDFAAAQIASAKAYELTPSYIAAANLGHAYFLQSDYPTARSWYHKSMLLLPSEDALRTGPLADFDWFIAHNWHKDKSRAEKIWYEQEAKLVLTQSQKAEEARIELAQQRLAAKEANFIKESKAAVAELNLELSKLQNLEKSPGHDNLKVTKMYQNLVTRFKYLANIYGLNRYYIEAEMSFKQALAISTKVFNNDHMEVADILRRMASSYQDQKRYKDATNILERALAIQEKHLGFYHADLFLVLINLADCYSEQERFNDAERLLKRIINVHERSNDNKLISTGLLSLSLVYQRQGRYIDADAVKLRADNLDTQSQTTDSTSSVTSQSFTKPLTNNQSPPLSPEVNQPQVAQKLNQTSDTTEEDRQVLEQAEQTLLSSGLMLIEQNHPVEAEKILQRWLNIRAALFGSNHPFFIENIVMIADNYKDKILYSYAEPLYQRAFTLSAKVLGDNHPSHIKLLRKIASFYERAGNYPKAETLYKQVLTIRQQVGLNSTTVAESLNDLCSFYQGQVRYSEAELLCRQALTMLENVLQPDHTDIAGSLITLADIYQSAGRYTEAETLYKRVQQIGQNLITMFPQLGIAPGMSTRLGGSTKMIGFSNIAMANAGLAYIYQQQKRYVEAEKLIKNIQDIYTQLYGANHFITLSVSGKLASLYAEQKRYRDAEPLAKSALELVQRTFGEYHPYMLGKLTLLAKIHREQGHYQESEVLYKQALAIAAKVYSAEHINNVRILQGLANVYNQYGQTSLALEPIRHASNILHQYSMTTTNDRLTSMDDKHVTYTDSFLLHLNILDKNQKLASTADNIVESFGIGQMYHDNDVGGALAEMAARSANGNTALANLARQQQDTLHAYQKADKNLIDLLSQPPDKRNTVGEQNLHTRLAELKKTLVELNAQLSSQFPDYMELVNSQAITVSQVQQLLKPDEGLIAYALGEEQSFVWLVTTNTACFRASNSTHKDIATQVQTLRAALSPDDNPKLAQPYPSAVAYTLYQDLLAPEAAKLHDIKTLFVAADGALENLPFAVLVTAPPPANPQDHAKVAWLSRKFATVTLPTVSSLRALRVFASKSKSANQPFVGFGDPNFSGTAGNTRGAGGVRLTKQLTNNSSGLADPQQLSAVLPPLPETADELRAIAQTLGANDNNIYLQNQASVTTVNATDLSQYRVVDFATHALVAGQVEEYKLGNVEPAIALTPPQVATVQDDGLLRASQVAQLKLNADWVVLSACNTAAADGSTGAVGLSGLAKAFFYAGARALLVSHWSVLSKPAVALTTTMFKTWQDNPQLGRAEALRQAQMQMLDHPAKPYFTHPASWAAFVVAGEGGIGR